MTKLQLLTGALAALATTAVHAQTFQGDGTAYTLGQVGQGNCAFMAAPPAASQNYAAINEAQWNGLKNCGRCAQVSCVDNACPNKSVSEIVHIVDRCPECKHGDLDLSPSVFKKITGSSPSRLKIAWKFVDCPGTNKLQYCLKEGSNPYWVAIQPANAGVGIASMTINGQATTMVDSAYYYLIKSQSPVDLSKIKVSVTASSGATVEETVSLSVGSCTPATSQFDGGSTVPPPVTTPKPTTSKPTETPKPATTSAAPSTTTPPKPTTTAPAPTTKSPTPTKTPKTPKPTSKTPKPDIGSDATTAPTPAHSTTSKPATAAPVTPNPAAQKPVTHKPATPAPTPADDTSDDDSAITTPTPGSDVVVPSPSPSPTMKPTMKPTPKPSKKCRAKLRRN